MAFSTDDTIVAIATPPGRGGLGVIRISGSSASAIAQALTGYAPLVPRHATFVRVHGIGAQDEAIMTFFPAPRSYTGQDVVELSLHGSPVVLRAALEAGLRQGARLAEPGEFTLRAYLSGRIDLVQAEAVRDLIDAVTPLQARAAFDQLDGTLTTVIREIDASLFELTAQLEASLDFPEEGYHFVAPGEVASRVDLLVQRLQRLLDGARAGRMIREGARVVLIGRPNAGKSTLFNALAGAPRAIVTDTPGTTRDLLTEVVEINGLAVTLVDTAGLRPETSDAIESEGMSRARGAAEDADLVLIVLDRSSPLSDEDRALLDWRAGVQRLVVLAKCDLPAAWQEERSPRSVETAAAEGRGLSDLRDAIAGALGATEIGRDTPPITNLRHVTLLERTREALIRARDAAATGAPEEFIAADLSEARSALEEMTGQRTADDTLRAIFERFCIGK